MALGSTRELHAPSPPSVAHALLSAVNEVCSTECANMKQVLFDQPSTLFNPYSMQVSRTCQEGFIWSELDITDCTVSDSEFSPTLLAWFEIFAPSEEVFSIIADAFTLAVRALSFCSVLPMSFW